MKRDSYSVQTVAVARQLLWQKVAMAGKAHGWTAKLQRASLQLLIAGGIGKARCNLCAIAAKTSARQCWVSQNQAGSRSSSSCQGTSAF